MEDLLPVQQNQSSPFTRLLSAFIDFSQILTGESFATQSSTTFVRQRDVLVQGHRWDLFTIQVHENTQQTRAAAAAAGYFTQNPLLWLLKVANTQHVHHCQRLLKNEEHGSARARLGTTCTSLHVSRVQFHLLPKEDSSLEKKRVEESQGLNPG